MTIATTAFGQTHCESISTSKAYAVTVDNTSQAGHSPIEIDDAAMLAYFTLPNSVLLASVDRFRPPQSWYDEDLDGLF